MNKQTILIVILIGVLAGTGYVWYRQFGATSSSSKGDTIRSASQDIETRLAQFRRLKEIQLDTAVLQDPLFRSLELPEKVVEPEVKLGRPNPFLPF